MDGLKEMLTQWSKETDERRERLKKDLGSLDDYVANAGLTLFEGKEVSFSESRSTAFIVSHDGVHLVHDQKKHDILWKSVKDWSYKLYTEDDNPREKVVVVTVSYFYNNGTSEKPATIRFNVGQFFETRSKDLGAISTNEFLQTIRDVSLTYVKNELDKLKSLKEDDLINEKEYADKDTAIRAKVFPYDVIDQLSKTADETS